MTKVSAPAGLRESTAKSQRNGHSGRGFAPDRTGSGGPVGPLGPIKAAMDTTTITVIAEKNTSFSMASPRKGTPCFNSSWYSAS